MRNNSVKYTLIAMFSLVCFTACEKQELTSCEGSGPKDEICKTLYYEQDVLTEVVEYWYGENNFPILQLHKNKKGKNIGKVTLEHNNQGLKTSSTYTDSKEEKIQQEQWSYDSSDRLINYKLVIREQETEVNYDYQEQKLVKSFKVNGVENGKHITNYVLNDTSVYEQLEYDAEGKLKSMLKYEWFAEVLRVEKYNGEGAFEGYEVQRFNEEGQLLENRLYDENSSLTSHTSYNYLNGKLKNYELNLQSGKLKRMEFLYH